QQQALEESSEEELEALVIDTNAFNESRDQEICSHLIDLRCNNATDSLYTSSTAKETFQQLLDLVIDGEDFKIIQASLLEAKDKIVAKNAALQAFPMSVEVRNQPKKQN
ncbi:unnamed protein product, partial [Allacma fusca]